MPNLSTINLGKYGSFHANDLVGEPYGLTYDIVERQLKVVPPRTIQEVGMILHSFCSSFSAHSSTVLRGHRCHE